MTDQNTPATISVPEAGRRYFGLSRNGAYGAAARGEIPTIRIGRLLRVPVRAMEALLDRAGCHDEPRGA
jgi:Helix-turn-helix domain